MLSLFVCLVRCPNICEHWVKNNYSINFISLDRTTLFAIIDGYFWDIIVFQNELIIRTNMYMPRNNNSMLDNRIANIFNVRQESDPFVDYLGFYDVS